MKLDHLSVNRRINLQIQLAYAAGCAALVLALVCLVGFIIRWCDWGLLPKLSQNAGNVGYGAAGCLVLGFVSMLKAAEVSVALGEAWVAASVAEAVAARVGATEVAAAMLPPSTAPRSTKGVKQPTGGA